MLIVYCEKCGHRVQDEELERGAAIKLDENQYLCSKCAPAQKPVVHSAKTSLPPTGMHAGVDLKGKSGARYPTRSARAASVTERVAHESGGRGGANVRQKSSAKIMIIAGAAFGVLAAVIIVVATSGRSAARQPVASNPLPAVVPQPVAPAPNPPIEPARNVQPIPPQPTPEPVRPPTPIPQPEPPQPTPEPAQPPTPAPQPTPEPAQPTPPPPPTPQPPQPATVMPEGGGEWTQLFDGKTLNCLNSHVRKGWRVANGAIEKVPKTDDAAQSARQFDDGEIRVRFELKGAEFMYFCARQGASGVHRFHFDRQRCQELAGKPHEVVFSCYRELVVAKLDGQPITAEVRGQPTAGHLQFNCRPSGLRILALDFRPFPAKTDAPKTPEPAKTPEPQVAGLPDEAAWKAGLNLLPLIDTGKDTVDGVWTVKDGALNSDRARYARLEFPYRPPEEYDFRIVFTRATGDGFVGQLLSRNSGNFMWMIAGWENTRCGIDYNGDAATVPFALDNGRKCVSVVQVRNDGARCFLDGKPIAEAKIDYQKLDMFGRYKLRDGRLLGLASQSCTFIIHSAEVIERTGKGTFTRPKANE